MSKKGKKVLTIILDILSFIIPIIKNSKSIDHENEKLSCPK